MHKCFVFLYAVMILMVMLSCVQPVSAELLKSEKPRITSPSITPAEVEQLVNDNSAFAFNLYQNVKSDSGNLFYSPYSLSVALAMTYAGARGATEKQMAEALHFTLPQEKLHTAFNAIDLELAKRGEKLKDKNGEVFKLHIVNALWGQKNYTFLAQFLDTLSQNYGAGLRILDFKNEPEKSRQVINRWVSEETEGRIEDLIPPGAIDTLTRLVLTNAIYFNAGWEHRFDVKATSDDDFYLPDGSTLKVPMMKQTGSFNYYRNDYVQAVELLYEGREMSMIIILPQRENFVQFESGLNDKKYDEIISRMELKRLSLSMPRFKYDSSFGLKPALAKMGMPIAFTDEADFSGMTGNRELCISDVVHKAFISVDEKGTEAAAASAVIMGLTSMPVEPPIEVKINSPFIFCIRDIKTGTVLFVGRVTTP